MKARTYVKQKSFQIGKHFSDHVHGIIINPKPTIKRIIREGLVPQDSIVPFLVVICAAIMTAFGGAIWNIALTSNIFVALGYTLKLFISFIVLPVWFVFAWVMWTAIFHFLGSIVSGKDISNIDVMHRSLKLVGLSMVPFFFNIFPFAAFITGYWVWVLCLWSMQENYEVSWKAALVITLPMLFIRVLFTLSAVGLLH
ncbi:MAG: YIP1 family protein [archaeon]